MAGGAPVVVQVGRAGTRLGEAAALGAARAAFAARHLAPLPSLFDLDLLGELARHVEAARFERRVHYLTPQPVSDLWLARLQRGGIALLLMMMSVASTGTVIAGWTT